MSLAVFTDSTTAQASPAFTLRPTSGSSTKTTSVSSACAWSVMPTVAVSPLTRTHSCDLAYFKSEGMLLIKIVTLFHRKGTETQRKNFRHEFHQLTRIQNRQFQSVKIRAIRVSLLVNRL